jgi:hypothetical protein
MKNYVALKVNFIKKVFTLLNNLNNELSNSVYLRTIFFSISLITFPISIFFKPLFIITIPSLILCKLAFDDTEKIKKELNELENKNVHYN